MFNKKIFPKINKKITGFLTDESGKITKKDALGLGMGTVLFAGASEANALTCSLSYEPEHTSSVPVTYVSEGTGNWRGNPYCGGSSHLSSIGGGHASGTLGGPLDGTYVGNTTLYSASHASHSSHQNCVYSCGCGGCG